MDASLGVRKAIFFAVDAPEHWTDEHVPCLSTQQTGDP